MWLGSMPEYHFSCQSDEFGNDFNGLTVRRRFGIFHISADCLSVNAVITYIGFLLPLTKPISTSSYVEVFLQPKIWREEGSLKLAGRRFWREANDFDGRTAAAPTMADDGS